MRAEHALAGLLALCLAGAAAARDVVFVLGEDAPGRTPFHGVAREYFRATRPSEALVSGARSLAEVREHLVRHHDGQPWDEVIVVVHGAPWVGLHVPVFADGPEATLSALEHAAASGEFPPLPVGTLSDAGIIRLESCGLGLRPDYLAAFGRLFSDARGRPAMVLASEAFVAYRAGSAPARAELPFASAVVAGDDPAALAAAGEGLAAELAHAPGQRSRDVVETVPIAISMTLAVQPGRRLPSPARAAASDPAVARRLRDHRLDPGELAWRSRREGDHVLQVEGRATLVLRRPRFDAQVFTPRPLTTARGD